MDKSKLHELYIDMVDINTEINDIQEYNNYIYKTLKKNFSINEDIIYKEKYTNYTNNIKKIKTNTKEILLDIKSKL